MNKQSLQIKKNLIFFNQSKYPHNLDSPKMLVPSNDSFFGKLLKPNHLLFSSKANKCNSTKSNTNNQLPQNNQEQFLHLPQKKQMNRSRTTHNLLAKPENNKKSVNQSHFDDMKQGNKVNDKKRQQLKNNKLVNEVNKIKDELLPQYKQKLWVIRNFDVSQGSKSFKDSQKSQKSGLSQNIQQNNIFLLIKEKSKERTKSLNKIVSQNKPRDKIPKFILQKSKKIGKQLHSQHDSSKSNQVKPINNHQEEQTGFGFEIKINVKPAIKRFSILDFVLLKQLGKGSSGKAILALERNTGFICVLKILQKTTFNAIQINQLTRQIKIQNFLQHKNLTSLYGCFADDDNLYIVLQPLPSGDLYSIMMHTNLKQNQSRISNYVYQICCGIKYMHDNHVLHRDIKPQNIFAFESYVKLGDFGCAVYSGPTDTRASFVGSPCYLSPEQLERGQYDEKVDIWQIGILTYELFFKKSPFEQDILQMMNQHHLSSNLSELKFPPTSKISEQAKSFMRKALMKDRHERMSINQALNHPFIKHHSHEQFKSHKDDHHLKS